MIYHICPPDLLFVKYCLDRFEKVRLGINRCIIIVSNHHINPRHNLDSNLVDYFGPLKTDIAKRINDSGCSGVIIHTLNDDILELALSLREDIPVMWRSWGPDLHDVLYSDFQPFLPHTKKLINNGYPFLEKVKSKIRPIRDLLLNKASNLTVRMNNKLAFLNRVNYIATVTNAEFDLLHAQIPGLKAEHIHLNYRILDLYQISEPDRNRDQNTVMVGHSSFPYHNHADSFFQLSGFSDYNIKILVPLNYGNYTYREKVIELGKELFKSDARYLIDFLPFNDYLAEIRRCQSFILNSKVQSGGANVIYSLLQGLKVYLRKENPIYKDFINAGIKLFTIQEDLKRDHLLKERLSGSEKRENLQILEGLFNPDKELQNVRDIYRNLVIKV